MIKSEILLSVLSNFETIKKHQEFYENQNIADILRYFGVPEHKSENLKCISDFLEKDNISIFMPKSVYENIDFSKFSIPKKLKFYPNEIVEEWFVSATNNLNKSIIELLLDEKDVNSVWAETETF